MIAFQEFEAKTGGKLDALDITGEVEEVVRSAGVTDGSALVFSPHTTCCVRIALAGLDTITAIERTMERLAPASAYYAHDDLDIRTENLVEDESANARAHIFHALAGRASECIPVAGGELQLDGRRVLFVELDCSRFRRYFVQVIGE